MPETTIHLECLSTPFRVIVEPWASPAFKLSPGEKCSVTVKHPTSVPVVSCGLEQGDFYIIVNDSGSTFSFARGEVVEFVMPVAIPQLGGAHRNE